MLPDVSFFGLVQRKTWKKIKGMLNNKHAIFLSPYCSSLFTWQRKLPLHFSLWNKKQNQLLKHRIARGHVRAIHEINRYITLDSIWCLSLCESTVKGWFYPCLGSMMIFFYRIRWLLLERKRFDDNSVFSLHNVIT
jgi:hypothetical protein